jgi:hypothetical protein
VPTPRPCLTVGLLAVLPGADERVLQVGCNTELLITTNMTLASVTMTMSPCINDHDHDHEPLNDDTTTTSLCPVVALFSL